MTGAAPEQDIIIKAAAVADYRPAVVGQDKIKKTDGDMSIALERTKDILIGWDSTEHPDSSYAVSPWKQGTCWKNSRAKLARKEPGYDRCQQLKGRRRRFFERIQM